MGNIIQSAHSRCAQHRRCACFSAQVKWLNVANLNVSISLPLHLLRPLCPQLFRRPSTTSTASLRQLLRLNRCLHHPCRTLSASNHSRPFLLECRLPELC